MPSGTARQQQVQIDRHVPMGQRRTELRRRRRRPKCVGRLWPAPSVLLGRRLQHQQRDEQTRTSRRRAIRPGSSRTTAIRRCRSGRAERRRASGVAIAADRGDEQDLQAEDQAGAEADIAVVERGQDAGQRRAKRRRTRPPRKHPRDVDAAHRRRPRDRRRRPARRGRSASARAPRPASAMVSGDDGAVERAG